MKHLIALAALATLGSAQAANIGFESAVPDGNKFLTLKLDDFVFSTPLKVVTTTGTGNADTAHTGMAAAINSDPDGINDSFSSFARADGADFSFSGLFARAWYDYGLDYVFSVEGWNNGALVNTAQVTMRASWVELATHFAAVDQVRMQMLHNGNNITPTSDPFQHFAIDDISVGMTTAAPIPEPETYALMLMGLGAVAFAARRRKAATGAGTSATA